MNTTKGLRLTNRAIDEQSDYDLNDDPAYSAACLRYYDEGERRYVRYGYWANRDVPTRNMIKALRLMPSMNTADDWARLHVTEAMLKMR